MQIPSENTGHVTNRKVRPTGAGGFMVCQEKSQGQGVGWLVRSKRKPHHALTPGGGRRQQGMAKKQSSRGCGGKPPQVFEFFFARVCRARLWPCHWDKA
mgnify:CR=1 FL=1